MFKTSKTSKTRRRTLLNLEKRCNREIGNIITDSFEDFTAYSDIRTARMLHKGRHRRNIDSFRGTCFENAIGVYKY